MVKKGTKITDPKRLETLKLAREKALATRRQNKENRDLEKKANAIQKNKKLKETKKIIEDEEKEQIKDPPRELTLEETKELDAEEENIRIIKKKPKKARKVIVVEDSDSSEGEVKVVYKRVKKEKIKEEVKEKPVVEKPVSPPPVPQEISRKAQDTFIDPRVLAMRNAIKNNLV